jgi:branched-chain amino acid transport system ATP-binding protein
VLLVDEMSLGLAPAVVNRLVEALVHIAESKQVGVLLVEQHVSLALRHAHRAYVLSGGQIRAEGSAADFLNRRHEIEASYLGRS